MLNKSDLSTWQLLALYGWKFLIFVPCHAIGWLGHTLDDASFRFMSATAPPVVRALFAEWDRDYPGEPAALERMAPR